MSKRDNPLVELKWSAVCENFSAKGAVANNFNFTIVAGGVVRLQANEKTPFNIANV